MPEHKKPDIEKKYDKDKWLKEKIRKYEDSLTSMRCYKASLKRIVKNDSTIKVIEDAVVRTNKIVIHTYQFLKMYCIYCFEINKPLPKINKEEVMKIMFTLADPGIKSDSRKTSDYQDFYDKHYKRTITGEKSSYSKLIQILAYEAVFIVTGINNHIQEKFEQMLNGYINILVDKKNITDDGEKKDVNGELRKIKQDLFHNTNKANPKYNHIKQYFKDNILKDFKTNKSLQTIASGKKKLDLLILLIRMSIDGERIIRNRLEDDDKKLNNFRIINAFPLRTSIRPRYITIDTVIAASMTCEGNVRKYHSDIKNNYEKVWKTGFRTEISSFRKKGYRFNNMIKTDGVACSVIFIREDLYGQKIDHDSKPFGYKNELYVNDLTDEEKRELSNMNFVGIDPGVDNIIFGVNGDVEIVNKDNGKVYRKAKKFSYNRTMRDHECLVKLYRKKIDDMKLEKIHGEKNVIHIESEISLYNSSTCNLSNLQSYVKVKNKVNSLLFDFYKRDIHRRLKWYAYMNRQRSEGKMLNRLEDAFRKPENTVILMGDWSRNSTPKNQVPVKGKSMRKLIKSRGYKLYLVNEFRTSCREYQTGNELDNFRWDKEKSRYVHRLLGSKRLRQERAMNKEDLKKSQRNLNGLPTIINRDLNAALNIRLKGMCIIRGENIPEYFNREKREKKNVEMKELIELILPNFLIGPKTSKVTKTLKNGGKFVVQKMIAERPGTKRKHAKVRRRMVKVYKAN